MNTIYVMQNEKGEEYWIARIHEGRVYDDINEYSSELQFDEIETFNVIHEHEYRSILALTQSYDNENIGAELSKHIVDVNWEMQQNALKKSIPLIDYIMKNI